MKRVFSCLVFLLLLNYLPFAVATSNFIKINLPKGVSFDLPRNWVVMSENQRITLDTSVKSGLDLANLEFIESHLPFAANYYTDNRIVVGMISFRYYPNGEISQLDVINSTLLDIIEYDAKSKKKLYQGVRAAGGEIVSYNGTVKDSINGIATLITEYRRKSFFKGKGIFRVRLVRVLAGDRSFTMIVSYHEKLAPLLKLITDRIIKSLMMNPPVHP